MEERNVRRSDLGTPQGGVISPPLENIYLNYFDVLWERHGKAVGELISCMRMKVTSESRMRENLTYGLMRRG